MVSILEPFIDTIIICTITGLVILSSGVWTEKFENRFEQSSMCYLEDSLSDKNPKDNKLKIIFCLVLVLIFIYRFKRLNHGV